MRDIAQHSLSCDIKLPQRYWRLSLYWIVLGALAFPTVIFIFYLMVFKPAFYFY